MNTFKVEVGDRSGDGHCMSEFVYFKCSLNSADIRAAFKLADQSLGWDLSDLCFEYDDPVVPKALIDELYSKGFTADGNSGVTMYCDVPEVEGPEGFVSFFLTIMSMFTPCEWSIVQDETAEISLPSFGYGLFCS